MATAARHSTGQGRDLSDERVNQQCREGVEVEPSSNGAKSNAMVASLQSDVRAARQNKNNVGERVIHNRHFWVHTSLKAHSCLLCALCYAINTTRSVGELWEGGAGRGASISQKGAHTSGLKCNTTYVCMCQN